MGEMAEYLIDIGLQDEYMYDHMFDEFTRTMSKICPDCGSKIVTKEGRYGKFRGCSNFPKCKYSEDYIED